MNIFKKTTKDEISKLQGSISAKNHKSNVLRRTSIRPSTSLKRTLFKVKSLRVEKVQKRQAVEFNNLSMDN